MTATDDAAAVRSSGGGAFLSIGAVLAQLRAEFPDVTISKIRFLETEGLVEPERTSSGYRKFSRADIERLRFVLSAQRDRYLPLRVIREEIEALDRDGIPVQPSAIGERLPAGDAGSLPAEASGGAASASPAADVIEAIFTAPQTDVRLSRGELCSAAGLSEDQLAQLEQYGLITGRPGSRAYDGDALLIARTVGQLARYGIEARHLRSLRAAADREAGLVEQVVAPLARQRDPAAHARAAKTAREIAALSVRLHAGLVKAALRNTGMR